MKTKYRGVQAVLTLLFLAIGAANTVQAASDDECAIWLCLPGGFPSGCGAAHSAMMDRLSDFKSPLPSFSSCVVSPDVGPVGEAGSTMTHELSYAARIAEHTVCTKKAPAYGESQMPGQCLEKKTVPAHYKKGEVCYMTSKQGQMHPPHCVGTYRYIDVFLDGEKTGETHYWQ